MASADDLLREAAEAARHHNATDGNAGHEWTADLQRTASGAALPNLANAAHALRHAADLNGMFSYDEMARQLVICRPLPTTRLSRTAFPRVINETDLSEVQEWLQHAALRNLGRDICHQAIHQVAREHGFHPVRDYLTTLQWDGRRRLKHWLHRYLGAEKSKYHESVGAMFLVAMVARIMTPGCKADYMLVLEGKQGSGKSRACAILGSAWYSDSLPDVTTGKDVAIHLSGKWLIEIAELSALDRAGSGQLKSFISRDRELYRPPYGRDEITVPRQCLFVGTTNKETYLRDETGARRFWPVRTGAIRLGLLERERDQLFAEAMTAYRKGTRWWPTTAEEQLLIMPQQADRQEPDVWTEPITKWLKDRSDVTILEAATDAVGLKASLVTKEHQSRIADVLSLAGWTRGKRTAHRRPWHPPRATVR